jgi:hypothetical protein
MPYRAEVAQSRQYKHACSSSDIAAIQKKLELAAKKNGQLKQFIYQQTNIMEVYDRYTNINFSFENKDYPNICPIPFTGIFIGAAGHCYPCLESAEIGGFEKDQKFIIADFNRLDSEEEQIRLILNSFYAKNMIFSFCNKYECSQGESIQPLLDYLNNPSQHNTIFQSPFF